MAQAPNSNRCDCQVETQSSDTLPGPRAGAKRTIPSEPQPEAKRRERRNSTNYSLYKAPPSLLNITGGAVTTTSKDDTPELAHQEKEGRWRTGGESNCGQDLQDRPESANRSPYTDITISPFLDPQGYEEIPSARVTDMLTLLRLDGTSP